MKNTTGVPKNTKKGLQAIPADSWPLYGVMGLPVNQFFLVVVAKDPHLFVGLNLIDKSTAVLTINQILCDFKSFSIMIGDMLRCIHVDHMLL